MIAHEKSLCNGCLRFGTYKTCKHLEKSNENTEIKILIFECAQYQPKEIPTKPLNKCKNCGNLFVPRRSNANFCPSPNEGKRSPCENRYNQMVSWSRKKILSGEKTVEEVAKMKQRPVEEVRGWIEDYLQKRSMTNEILHWH